MSRGKGSRQKSPPSGYPGQPAPQSAARRYERVWVFVAVGIIVFVSALRWIHLGFPLERDEGEFGYVAQEILRGVPVYESAHTQKLPGGYVVYAVFLTLFGHTAAGIHTGLLLVNAAIMALLFLILRRSHGGLAGCLAALTFGIMALSPGVLGFAAHGTFFVALFATAGLYALVHARERDRTALYFASGLCFGFAFLMKQSGIVFAPLALLVPAIDYLASGPRRPARFMQVSVTIGLGALSPLLATVAYYLAIGRFHLFWFWTVETAFTFAGRVSLAEGVKNLRQGTAEAVGGFEILWVLALAGLVATLRGGGRERYPYTAFAVACVLSVVPGLYFTNHYYISALPAVALLVGALASPPRGVRKPRRGMVVAAVVCALAGIGLTIGVGRYAPYYFGGWSDAAVSRRVYGSNPFAESEAIGQYLNRNTSTDDRIAVLGSETQILFYARRRSASQFVNTYFLANDREMQREMIRDIEDARPKYFLIVSITGSWAFSPTSPQDIIEWTGAYTQSGYDLEGLLELGRGGRQLYWGTDARARPAPADPWIRILRKRE